MGPPPGGLISFYAKWLYLCAKLVFPGKKLLISAQIHFLTESGFVEFCIL